MGMNRLLAYFLAIASATTGLAFSAAAGPDKGEMAAATLYVEKYRPQFHVTARQWTVDKPNPQQREEGWINDINGLIYHKGQYHLFAQRWARCWLHFVSKDLIHWTELQPAFWDDDRFGSGVQSGTIVFDSTNASGLSTDPKKPPLVAFWSGFDNRSQCLSFSTDDGLTWTKYEKNPYMIHPERDPDVFWYEPEKRWIMLLSGGGSYHFLTSKNLRDWTKTGKSIPDSYECPDMFQLPLDSDIHRQKWVVVRGNGNYSIGEFDGVQFTPDGGQQPCDLGANFYATQSWGNIAGQPGRRVQIAWMRGGKYPDMPFNQQLTFPCDLTLHRFPEGLRICRMPVGEIKSLYAREYLWNDRAMQSGENLLKDVSGELFDIELEVDLAGAREFGIKCRGQAVTYLSEQRTLNCLGRKAAVEAENGRIKLRILIDRTSIEVFANGGKVAVTSFFLPTPDRTGLELFSDGGNPKIASMKVRELMSIWPTERGRTPSPAATVEVDYARDVEPILQQNCIACHGPTTQSSNLRLDRRASILQGGDSGEKAVVVGRGDESRLVKLIGRVDPDNVMPPKGKPLSDRQVGLIRAWIDQGMKMPEESSDAAKAAEMAMKHWSLQPVVDVAPPKTTDRWAAGPIDAFVLEKLMANKLRPAPPAQRVQLLRRLYLDMLGLPPTPEQIEQFVADTDSAAYAHAVDDVLRSPRYGERWARHWLDVIRFADTDGYENNAERPNSYRFRDYLIRAFNEDRPFDRMVVEQLAGDAVGEDAATGFIVGGAVDRVSSPDVVLTRTQRQDELADMIGTTGSTFLGMTIGCAKCHDHKFDPIPQRDYYAMQAVFAGVKHQERPLRFVDGKEVKKAETEKPSEKKPSEKKVVEKKLKKGEGKEAMVYGGQFKQPEATFRLHRGDPMQPKEAVVAEAPSALTGRLGSLGLKADSPEQQRRLALGRWIARADNPLTARVIVNRLWHYHFGAGIVASPSDFGRMGSPPTHGELLDWLATELVRNGWRLKAIHREILLSNTYQQADSPNALGLAADAGCRWLWRYPPRRLEAEAIRDSILQASGVLDLKMYGPGFGAFEPNDHYVRVYTPKTAWGPPEWRRMVYMNKIRREQDGIFGVFDAPDAGQVCPKRSRSTTAIQALNLLNSQFMVQQSQLLAARVEREVGKKPADGLRRTFLLTLGRTPHDDEASAGEKLIESHGLASVCRALFNTNEFLFVP